MIRLFFIGCLETKLPSSKKLFLTFNNYLYLCHSENNKLIYNGKNIITW